MGGAVDNQLVGAVAVGIGGPDGVAPLQLVIENVALPERLVRLARRRVHDDFVAVPRLDRRQERRAVLQLPLLDFTGATAAILVRLISGPNLLLLPFVAVAGQPMHALVTSRHE